MLKFLRPLVLFAAAAGLTVAATPAAAPAQKEKDKKDDKTKVDPKKVEEVGTVEVYQAKDGWRFKVVVDGKAIAIGTVGQDTKADALKVVEALKATLAKGKVEVIDDKKK